MYTKSYNKDFSDKIKKDLGWSLCNILSQKNAVLAGGAIVSLFYNQKINDYDIFFNNKEDFGFLQKYIHQTEPQLRYLTLSGFAVTFFSYPDREWDKFCFEKSNVLKVQLIRHKYGTATEILDSFDLSFCKGGYLFQEDAFLLREDFFAEEGKIDNFTNAISSVLRTYKYLLRGYKINKDSIATLLMFVKMNDYLNEDSFLKYFEENSFYPPINDYKLLANAPYSAFCKCYDILLEYVKGIRGIDGV